MVRQPSKLARLAEELFQQAADLPEASRQAFLEEQCGSDHALRHEVDSLLRHEDQASDSFLEGPPEEVTRGLPIDLAGTTVGRYRVLQPLGQGGFGEVYVAEQTEPVRRRVALKIIKAGMDTKQVLARFEAERQVLALMDHPGVARMFDAGTTDGGRPYFVMEYLPGAPVTEHCDRQRLSVTRRLNLFMKICDAVQHAHHKGVIHRDLKPSNILVTDANGDAVPKVIDFGVAKATDSELHDRADDLHRVARPARGYSRVHEPGAGGPHGISDIDTRADVYSLGALLYELLVGVPPFDSTSFTLGGFRTRRCDAGWSVRKTHPNPSTRVSEQSVGPTGRRPPTAGMRRTDPKSLVKRSCAETWTGSR